MNVTRENFVEVLPLVEKCVSNADFMSIDGEFTGISLNDGDNWYDTLEERYEKISHGSKDFLLLQFGLSTFRWNVSEKVYLTNSFNFYLFPLPCDRSCPDLRFVCQASSINFLVAQGFDFNKTFKEGIPYLSHQEEMRRLMKLNSSLDRRKSTPSYNVVTETSGNKNLIKIPEEQKDFVTSNLNMIRKFLSENEDWKKHLDLPPCSPFQRKLIYQYAEQEFGSRIIMKTRNTKERSIRVSIKSDDSNQVDYERQTAEKEISDAIGFSKVIKLISQSGKLVIGHNMYLDLIHTVHQFYVPLPERYDQFKSVMNSLFPQVCDTKLMASLHPFREHIAVTTLGDLDNSLKLKPFKDIAVHTDIEGASYSTTDEKLHEAAFDAFVTGKCFIRMANHLGSFQSPEQPHVAPTSELLKPYINKVFVMRIADITYMDLVGQDLNPSRENVFHVTLHDERIWSGGDVRQYFASTGVLSVAWLDQYSFYVGIPRDSLETFSTLEHSSCTVTPYKEYKDRQLGHSLRKRRSGLSLDTSSSSNHLNVHAKPFISRESSPVSEKQQPQFRDEHSSSKRLRTADSESELDDTIAVKKPHVTLKQTDNDRSLVEDVMFRVPDVW